MTASVDFTGEQRLVQRWDEVEGGKHCTEILIDATDLGIATTDILKLMTIDFVCLIDRIELIQITPEGGAAALNIGLYDYTGLNALDADGFLEAADNDINTTANKVFDSKILTGAYAAGYRIDGTATTALTICATSTAALDTAVLLIRIHWSNLKV